MQTDDHNLSKNVKTNKKYILRKGALKFCKISFYMSFAIKPEPFWANEIIPKEVKWLHASIS